MGRNWRWRKYRSAGYCLKLDAEHVTAPRRNQETLVASSSTSIAEQVVRPARIEVPQLDLDDLRSRLERTRWSDELTGAGSDYGVPIAYVRHLVLAGFGGDFHGIRRFAERDHENIVRWTTYDHGGHFAAHKAPDLYVSDVRAFFRAGGR
jgi:pimeloyl-ACP methyl ester carboxylesterase